MDSSNVKQYWFPAKTYGWGWGMPTAWQGWVVMLLFAVFLLVGAVVLLPNYGQLLFVGYSFLLTVVLVSICWAKGEPPSWRWGK
jgi:hypothetical protein